MAYEHFKKGVQYSHYTGTERQELSSLAWLINHSEDMQEIKKHARTIGKIVTELSEKIALLDLLNELN